MPEPTCADCQDTPSAWCGCWGRRVCAAHEDKCARCVEWEER